MALTIHTKKKKCTPIRIKETRTAYLLLIPAILGLIFITYLPLLASFGISFYNWKGLGTPTFIGLANYKKLFTTDPYFIDSIKATVSFAMLAVVGSMIYSLFVALLLNRRIPARAFWRAVFYLPYMLPAIAVYIGWQWLYDTSFGLLNYLLSSMGIARINFLGDPKWVLPALATIAVWTCGNLIVIFLAGFQNVPRVYHEAAEIDGANSWQRFWNITIPCMTPIIFYNLLMSLITNMQVVTPALALTDGGPGNSTTFMTYLMYRYAFKSNQLGYACAISFVFFILIAIFTIILFVTSKSWIFYEGGDDR